MLDPAELKSYMKIREDMDDAMAVSVKVDWREVLTIVARDLINKRNACRDPKLVQAFDTVLRSYYLTEDEHKVAIEGHDIGESQ